MSEANDRLQHHLIRILIYGLALVPRRVMARIAIPLGSLWYRIDRHHRAIATDNMSRAFHGEVDAADIPGRVKANFIQLTTAALEMPSLLKLNRDNLDTYVTFSGSQHLKAALSRGKGVLFLSAHLGNWELMALATALKFDFQCHLLVRPLDFSPMDRVLTDIRCRTGNKVLDKIRSAGVIRKLLGENEVLGMMLDQSASWYDGVYVPFFGRTACTHKGFGLFALRYDPTVLPLFNIRQADGRYKITFDPPVTLQRSGNVNRDLLENTAAFNRIIEKHIRMAPDNWLWVHRRWRPKEIPTSARKKMAALSL
ncbi:MAG: lysophospholipid acyltransferase family protein [Desulfobacterales bacterium]